jgi:hypothetical protein
MMDADFPEELCLFIQKTIPTIDAAELLVLLARDPARHWRFGEIVHELRPTEIAESEIKRCLALFLANGLVVDNQDAGFQYRPATPSLDATVHALAKVFNQRPVTLIRVIYSRKIQSFADAFKFKKD